MAFKEVGSTILKRQFFIILQLYFEAISAHLDVIIIGALNVGGPLPSDGPNESEEISGGESAIIWNKIRIIWLQENESSIGKCNQLLY